MEELTDPALDRFLSALRRAWWFVVLCILVIAVLFGLRAGPSQFRSAGSARYADESGTLEAAKLPSDLISRTISLKSDLGALSSDSVESEIGKAVGRSVDITTAVDSKGEVVTISVTSATASSADTALDQYVGKLRQRRSDQVRAAASTVIASLDAERAADLRRIAVLDEQIRELGTSDISLSDAYRLERTERTDELTSIDSKKAAIDVYQAGADNSVQFVKSTAARKAGGALSNVVLGGVLGAVIGLGLVSVYSYFDRRTRSAADLQTAGLKLLAVSGTDRNESASTAVASCLAAEADVSGSADFLFIALDGSNSASLIARVQADLKPLVSTSSVVVVSDESASSEGLILARTIPQVVLFIPWGKFPIADVSATARRYSLAGAKTIGCVLVDVPARYLRSAFA